MRFLVIDDSMPMRRIIANVLGRLGHTDVVLATNGREALEQIQAEPVDFIITDWYMPEMSGVELLRALRANASMRDVPIVMVTANASKADVVQALKLGVTDYILKPFTADLLKDRIAAICASLARDPAADTPPEPTDSPA